MLPAEGNSIGRSSGSVSWSFVHVFQEGDCKPFTDTIYMYKSERTKEGNSMYTLSMTARGLI